MIAAIDVQAVADGIAEIRGAILGIGAVVIGAGIALGALRFGSKWALDLFSSMSDGPSWGGYASRAEQIDMDSMDAVYDGRASGLPGRGPGMNGQW